MASPIGDVGTGASILFQSGYFGKILNIEWTGISRPAVKITAFDDTIDQFLAGDLYDPGELNVDVLADVTTLPHIDLAVEAIELIFGNVTGDSRWQANGFMTEYSVVVPLEDKIVGSAKIKFTGQIVHATVA